MIEEHELVCEAHPPLDWPHGNCPGPGMPCQAGRNVLQAKVHAAEERANLTWTVTKKVRDELDVARTALEAAQETSKRLVEALTLVLPFVEDEWEGTRGCLMPSCAMPMDSHTPECPIGIALAAISETDGTD